MGYYIWIFLLLFKPLTSEMHIQVASRKPMVEIDVAGSQLLGG